jgi:integrase/recombinase XerC
MMQTDTTNHSGTLEEALSVFLRSLIGKNRSSATIAAYQTDIMQFLHFLHETNIVATQPAHVQKLDISEYLSYLGERQLSGVTRARKLAAIREYFRFCTEYGYIASSPAAHFTTPKKEKNGRAYLRPDEYSKLLSLAGSNPRDFAILQVFLQTGLRVTELINLRIGDIDLPGKVVRVSVVTTKGMVARTIDLEKKAIHALKNYLAIRPPVQYDQVFLNRNNEPYSRQGIGKLVRKYLKQAGISKKVSCHSLRHTFATYKAERGVSPFQLKEWLGHQNLNTTQIYVHMARQNAQKVMEATSL